MANPRPMERKIYLKKNVDEESMMSLIEIIHKINDDDDEKEKEYKDWVREPIELYIYTYGGVCYAGFALIDTIKASKTPVHTIALGAAMSMGIFIFTSGHKRIIGEHATLMYHDVSLHPIEDKLEGIKNDFEEGVRLSDMGAKLLINSSLVTQEKVNDYRNRKTEWYISAEEAIKLKIADEYYK